MTLQQLRYLVEVAQRGYNVSDAAEALFTSQPGVSKQIKQLENDLGITIFERVGKRLIGVTEAGAQVLSHAQRILAEADNLKRYVDDYTHGQRGSLVIATTHTQARYALPEAVSRFRDRYPEVTLSLHQGMPDQFAEWLVRGDVDLAIATEALKDAPGVVALPCRHWHHTLVVPIGHPLQAKAQVGLGDLAAYPIVTYVRGVAGRIRIDQVFERAGLAPRIVLDALDADVIKTYVGVGMGVGIIAEHAFDAQRDGLAGLCEIRVRHLFPVNTTYVGIRRGTLLRRFEYDFIEDFAPDLTRGVVQKALQGGSTTESDWL
jgi:LysR family transcriptional regulator, cys regulon transcriptional activator